MRRPVHATLPIGARHRRGFEVQSDAKAMPLWTVVCPCDATRVDHEMLRCLPPHVALLCGAWHHNSGRKRRLLDRVPGAKRRLLTTQTAISTIKCCIVRHILRCFVAIATVFAFRALRRCAALMARLRCFSRSRSCCLSRTFSACTHRPRRRHTARATRAHPRRRQRRVGVCGEGHGRLLRPCGDGDGHSDSHGASALASAVLVRGMCTSTDFMSAAISASSCITWCSLR